MAPVRGLVGRKVLLTGRRQIGIDGRKGRLQLRTESVDDRNDGDGNAGRDQTIFDGGGAGFVSKEPLEGVHLHLHSGTPFVTGAPFAFHNRDGESRPGGLKNSLRISAAFFGFQFKQAASPLRLPTTGHAPATFAGPTAGKRRFPSALGHGDLTSLKTVVKALV